MAKLRYILFLLIGMTVFCTSVNALGDLQTTMCNAADEGCTCDRLGELGFVTEAECCSALGKCCPITTTCSQAGGSCKDIECSKYNDLGCTCVRAICPSGLFCCKGTCTASTQTCAQAGGSCKDTACNAYTDCNSAAGACDFGYCCSGTCTAITTAGCSSDIECAQCGDACISKTQWSETCASPTTEFECKCLTNTCTRTLKQAEKTVLPDCTIACVNQNGCICSSECTTSGEIALGLDCGGKKTPEIQEVSLCDGCMIDRTCIRAGIQKRTAEGGSMFYCGMDKKLGWVKNIGEPCVQNHECFSYLCKNNICSDKPKEEKKDYKLAIIFGGIVFFIGLASLIFKFFSGNKATKKEEEKKIGKQGQFTKPIYTQKEPYKYKPELDVLEKQLKEALKK